MQEGSQHACRHVDTRVGLCHSCKGVATRHSMAYKWGTEIKLGLVPAGGLGVSMHQRVQHIHTGCWQPHG